MLNFTKLSATGNDFILIDNRDNKLTGKENIFFEEICQRRKAVGADGILLIRDSSEYDFNLTYYNSDGYIGEMCGNGARAAAFYAFTHQIAQTDMTFDVLGVPYRSSIKDDWVKLYMPAPVEIKEFPGAVEETEFEEGGYLNVGVPHYVLFCNNIENPDVDAIGRKYRYHKAFQPWGTNVNFVQIIDDNNFKMRTYERGVEEETLACGTGTISSAILARKQKRIKLPVTVQAPGGLLRVDFDDDITEVMLEGQVQIAYYGKLKMH